VVDAKIVKSIDEVRDKPAWETVPTWRFKVNTGGKTTVLVLLESRKVAIAHHVIILNERHLKRLMSSYVLYYHEDRTHLGLAKDTPAGRPTAIRPERASKIQSFPRLGGLHHRYAVAA